MRKLFVKLLHEEMQKNDKVWLLTGDLGFGVLDKIKDDFPDRFVNCGVAEANMIGVACGMASQGLIPFVYSITPFLIDRAYEFIKIDVDFDKANVKLVGAGRRGEYKEDGFTHFAYKSAKLIGTFDNIKEYWPTSEKEVKHAVKDSLKDGPVFISLSRYGVK